jgi:hypothetical protein
VIFSRISGIKDAQKLVLFDMSDLERPDTFGTRPPKGEEQRDSAWPRWVKLLSIIVVSAIVLGLVFALRDYVRQYTACSEARRAMARGWVKLDTWDWMRRRFVLGACAGAAFSLLYLIQRHLMDRVP